MFTIFTNMCKQCENQPKYHIILQQCVNIVFLFFDGNLIFATYNRPFVSFPGPNGKLGK